MKIKSLLLLTLLTPALLFAQQAATTDADSSASASTPTYSTKESRDVNRDSMLYDPLTFDTKFDKVKVVGRATRAEQKGDSLIYNASAFKVLDGSSVEDLLAKMPGIVVEGGEVQAQGESVKKVLVDGKEFFEGDVNLAIRSIPSDAVSSIEVFDKASEQAEFTGFDDGEQTKTINIVTKESFKYATFGEAYAGYGTDDRYKVGGNFNMFGDTRRLSILGMSNNINQQNFSQEDLAGVMSSSSSSGARRGPGSNSNDSFMVGSSDGVTSSNAIGVNYIDEWFEKVKFTGSYFMNQSNNDTNKLTDREYFEASMIGMTYDEYYESQTKNWNHRLNTKFDYTINPNNTITIIPKFSFQNNTSDSYLNGENFLDGAATEGVTTDSDSDNIAYTFSTEAIYRHRFKKTGRTISVTTTVSLSNTDKDSYTDYINSVTGTDGTTETTSGQLNDNLVKSLSLRSNVMYTEQLARKLQLMTSYRLSYSKSDSDKKVYDETMADIYDQLNEDLSSSYESDYITHAGNLGLRYNNGKLMVMAEGTAQFASLNGVQEYPAPDDIDNNYFNLLPSMFGRYTINRSNSLMFRYRSSTSNPSVSDLQEVVDNSNSLFLSSGNPDLDQQVNHTASLRYIRTTTSGTSIIVMLGGTVRQDYVADSTFVATGGETIAGITLDEGVQFTRPVNLDGYYSVQSMFTYGFPVDFIRSNVNLSISANLANVPTIFNGVKSNTRELDIVPKVVIGSNISDKLDFTTTYSSAISQALSSDSDSDSNDYITHTATAKFGWEFWKGFTLRSSASYVNYAGIDLDDPDYILWGASLGKKFLKKKAAEMKIEATDLLNQNRSFDRTVGSNYYEYTTCNVLQPYVMLTFQYTFR